MGRRFLVTLLVAALGVGAWLVARRGPPADEGLVVHVHVVDQAGEPIENAQVQKTFAPGWVVVNRGAYKRLRNVPLRAGEVPSPEALKVAVQARARFYTLRQGFEPEVTPRDDGSWAMRFPLHHHGVLRVHVRDTHLGDAKAYPEPDEPLRRWEAMDLGNVARPGRPAAYRVYPGLAHVVVRLLGEPDMHGATGVATRRFFFEPPNPGHIVEKTLVPDAVNPILGSVVVPHGGPRPPTLRGAAHIAELAVGGRRIEHDPVPIDDDGRFVVRKMGAGRYELRAVCDFLTPTTPVIVAAGDIVELKGAELRPWLEIHHPPLDVTAPHVSFHVNGGQEAAVAGKLVPDGRELTRVPLQDTGLHLLAVRSYGTREEPPGEVERRLEVEHVGPTEVHIDLAELPHGTLVVRAAKGALEQGGRATVWIGEKIREATLLSKIAEEARFENLPAHGFSVLLTWQDEWGVLERQVAGPEAGKTTTVTLAYRRGGFVHLRGTGPRAADDARERLIVASERQGKPEATRRCIRHGPAPIWVAESALPPGEYNVLVLTGSDWDWRRGSGDVEAELEFTIEAGKTTVVDFEVK